MNLKKPNLFIIGAPKCGTTSLANYLNQHPNIGMCKYKEPFYFANEFKELHKVSNLKEYLSLYDPETLSKDIVFEGSTHYLMSFNAIDNILRFNPDAKFICMVRNPYDMIPSWHDELVYQGHQSLNLEEAMKKAVKLHKETGNRGYSDSKMMDDYLHVASNGSHVKRLLSKVKLKKIKFIVFDDFISNTEKVFNSVCIFLNIDEASVNFEKMNSRKYNRYPKLVKVVRKIGNTLSFIGINETGLGNKLIGIQLDKTKKERRFEYSEYAINFLNEDIQLLQESVNVDLTQWIKAYG